MRKKDVEAVGSYKRKGPWENRWFIYSSLCSQRDPFPFPRYSFRERAATTHAMLPVSETNAKRTPALS